MQIGDRYIGPEHLPFVITEIGINHGGDFDVAKKMIHAAKRSGAMCVKFQCHIPEEEMVPNDVVPANSNESIWSMMNRCALTEDEEFMLKQEVERLEMVYLCTPFSVAAVERLERFGVLAYKIGSGEVSNPLILRAVAETGKPVIMSTGMHTHEQVSSAVKLLESYGCSSLALLHCNSIYPTPVADIRLGMVGELGSRWPGRVVGFSDHSQSIYPAIASVALGASIIERHFTDSRNREGPDIPISDTPLEHEHLIHGALEVRLAMTNGSSNLRMSELQTLKFAASCIVATAPIQAGSEFTLENVTAKRPGTGQIRGHMIWSVLGFTSTRDIQPNESILWSDIGE